MPIIKTNISQAYWCSTERNKISNFNKAIFQFGDNNEHRHISWLDELLDGGIKISQTNINEINNNKSIPLTFLITGPPGSGKTTFAMELCYRLAMNENKLSLYISTESETYNVVENARSFGFDIHKNFIKEYKEVRPDYPSVTVYGKEQYGVGNNVYKIVDLALRSVASCIIGSTADDASAWLTKKVKLNSQTNQFEEFAPDILVIDSLNVIEKGDRSDFFQKLLQITSYGGSEILICVLDDEKIGKQYSPWSHICDIVINLNYTNIKDYYLRTIEIVKARFQSHAWGKHQLKIYPKNNRIIEISDALNLSDHERIRYNRKLKRAHPYRKEGGIFIYPSVHYYLSAYKRSVPETKPEPVDTLPERLNNIIQFPRGRCTAMFGCRGAHKSHLAFLHMLHRIYKNNECALIISLRDDEQMTKKTMGKILWREFYQKEKNLDDTDVNIEKSNEKISEFINNEQLEILYFHPGYITPEEFFHRVYMSIQRLKTQNMPVTVMFNSLDQLSSRFPLCAKQEIFIPSLATAFSGEEITSIFIAVDEPGQPVELYGLLPLADLVLSFYPHLFKFSDYYKHLNKSWKFENQDESFIEKAKTMLNDFENTMLNSIVLEVVRYAGGRRAGARGLLELINKKDIEHCLYKEPGLHFTELSDYYDHGKPLGVYRFPRG